jgi:hypothetical protein
VEELLVERMFKYQRDLDWTDLVQYSLLCAESPDVETIKNMVSTAEKQEEWRVNRPKELTELEEIEALEETRDDDEARNANKG